MSLKLLLHHPSLLIPGPAIYMVIEIMQCIKEVCMGHAWVLHGHVATPIILCAWSVIRMPLDMDIKRTVSDP